MNCTTTAKLIGSLDQPPLSEAVAVAKKLSEINRLRRASFRAYPGMDHIPVKILLHIFLGQNASVWAAVDDIPEAVGIRSKTVQRYLDFLASVGLAETIRDSTGLSLRARLSAEAMAVVSGYLQAIAALVSRSKANHQ